MTARVVALQVRTDRQAPPIALESAQGRLDGGMEGDFHVAKTTRAVLVVDRSTLDDLGLAPGDLREQVTVEGLREVTSLAPGALLRMGGIALRVNGPCDPCTHIGELLEVADREAFRVSLVGRRGAVCTVVQATAPVRVGDEVEVVVPAVP